jgi:hypothetical protein
MTDLSKTMCGVSVTANVGSSLGVRLQTLVPAPLPSGQSDGPAAAEQKNILGPMEWNDRVRGQRRNVATDSLHGACISGALPKLA